MKKLMFVCLIFISFAFIGLFAESSFSLSTEEDRNSISVTIYNGGMGLVRETRKLTLPKGVKLLRYEDVASQILPQTVRIKSEDSQKLKIFEQNYEYDLISHERLMDKYIGKEVTIYREHGEKEGQPTKATLISNNGSPVYKIGNEISLGYFGRVTVPTLPDNLFAKPTLVWKLKNDEEKEQTLEVSYQTHGMNWSADYILTLDKEESLSSLNSWVTLTNTSGTRFTNATLQLVAGKVQLLTNRQPEYAPITKSARYSKEMESMSDVAPEFQQENLSEYYLYTLDQPTTIGYNQTKQVQLFQTDNVNIKKYFVFENLPMYEGNEKKFNNATVKYIFKNDKKSNLGRPLPSGTVRVFKADSKGRQQLLGEDTIDHTPENEDVKIKTGQAFDVVANGKRMSYEEYRLSSGFKASYMAEIRNRKKEDIEVRFYASLYGDWNISKSSHKFLKESSTRAFADVAIKAGETVKIEYTVDTKY